MYDSQEEKLFHQRNLLLILSNKVLPFTFYDDNAQAFNAKGDFYHSESNTIIEFKAHQLNTSKTQSDAEAKYNKSFSQEGLHKRLKFSWNHSVFKQAKVCRHITNLTEYNFLLVFKDGTKLSPQAKNRMNKEQLNWCFESEYLEKLNCA